MSAAAGEITAAVAGWLAGLDDRQRQAATFPFDTSERFVWGYVPGAREGLAIRDMRPDQRAAAASVIASSMSARTAGEINGIVGLETVLGELERAAGRSDWSRRDPELYWLAVFGEPDAEAWSWRIGGHHVAIHITLADGRVVGTTPSFLGANPAVVPSGPLAGKVTLPGEEALARELLSALTPDERRVAIVDERAPADILSGTGRRADARSVPVGIRYPDLPAVPRALLERLLRHYIDRVRPDIAEPAWARIVEPGLDALTFAWAGSDIPGHGHYYAIRGPTFVVEYDNTQNGANHIHAVWRDLENDWGEDLLAAHLAAAHAMP